MSSILRKFKKILGFQYSNSDQDELAIGAMQRSGKFTEVKKVDGEISFRYNGALQAYARTCPHSDMYVSNQVLIQQEYRTVVDFFRINFPGRESLRIIDAGANVGYSSMFFLSEYPNAQIACVEPDGSNLQVLKKNLAPFISNKQVRVFQNGLMSEGGKSIATKNDFRDGKDWSVSVSEVSGDSDLKSVSVQDIMREMNWGEVDIIKMDIEGSERFVFQNDSDLNFLDRTSCLAIEIHDEFGCRDDIYGILRKHDFVILNYAETTFAIAKKMIGA